MSIDFFFIGLSLGILVSAITAGAAYLVMKKPSIELNPVLGGTILMAHIVITSLLFVIYLLGAALFGRAAPKVLFLFTVWLTAADLLFVATKAWRNKWLVVAPVLLLYVILILISGGGFIDLIIQKFRPIKWWPISHITYTIGVGFLAVEVSSLILIWVKACISYETGTPRDLAFYHPAKLSTLNAIALLAGSFYVVFRIVYLAIFSASTWYGKTWSEVVVFILSIIVQAAIVGKLLIGEETEGAIALPTQSPPPERREQDLNDPPTPKQTDIPSLTRSA